jgi:hypothetical protein
VSSVTTTFAFNGDGLRDSLTTGGNTTTFTWDVNRSIPQVLDDEDLRYVYGIGCISQVSGSATHYYLSDGLGSTMALTDADGAVVNDYDYDVFGALRDSSGVRRTTSHLLASRSMGALGCSTCERVTTTWRWGGSRPRIAWRARQVFPPVRIGTLMY